MGHVILLYHQNKHRSVWKESLELLVGGWDTFLTSWCNSQKQQRPTIRYYCKQQQPPFGMYKNPVTKKTEYIYSYHINWLVGFLNHQQYTCSSSITSSSQISYQETNISTSPKNCLSLGWTEVPLYYILNSVGCSGRLGHFKTINGALGKRRRLLFFKTGWWVYHQPPLKNMR